MIRFVKRLFASPEAIDKTVDGIYSGLDKVVFTPEERADAVQKANELYSKMWMAAVPSAVSRRLIASAVVVMWMVVLITMLVAKGLGMDDFAKYAAEIMGDLVFAPFNVILSFYFLSHLASKVKA